MDAYKLTDKYLQEVVNQIKKKPKGLKIIKAPCEDCKGELNDQGKHVDCRTCNNTGIK